MSAKEVAATQSEARTLIEDLPASAEELAEPEAELTSGGFIRSTALSCCDHVDTYTANTCTAGNPLTGADADYATDH